MKIKLVDKDTNEIIDEYVSDGIEPKERDLISLGEEEDEKVFLVEQRKIYKNSFVIVCYGKKTKMSYLKNNNH